jgi:hypothetical protein
VKLSSPERPALRGLLRNALGPLAGTLVWLLVALVSAVSYPWAWAWSNVHHWHRLHDARERRLAWCGAAAACALLMSGLSVARHVEAPALFAHAAVHAVDGCVGGHRAPRHC